MKMIQRNRCVVSNKNDLELLYSFKNFPIFMGCIDHSPKDDIKTDMNWWISKNGCIQLNPLIPLEVLYKDSHGSGTTGKLWDAHHREFAKFINEFSFNSVLEIGAGHDELSHNYLNLNPNVKWTIIDPNPNIKSNNNIRVMNRLFDSGFKSSINFDSVIHSHVLEHVYDPYGFIKDISGIIDIGNWHIFSIPNLRVMLEKKYTNCLNFEHTIFITEALIEYWLKKAGFEIIEKKYFMEDHSIFYATVKSEPSDEVRNETNEYEINKRLFMGFIRFHENLIYNLNNKMDGFDGKVYLFGGHIFTQYLIGFGLNIDKIECILDNDINKQNKRLYGAPLIVRSPKILKNMKNVAVILRAGGYNNEIKDDIINNINNNVEFWE